MAARLRKPGTDDCLRFSIELARRKETSTRGSEKTGEEIGFACGKAIKTRRHGATALSLRLPRRSSESPGVFIAIVWGGVLIARDGLERYMWTKDLPQLFGIL